MWIGAPMTRDPDLSSLIGRTVAAVEGWSGEVEIRLDDGSVLTINPDLSYGSASLDIHLSQPQVPR